MAATSAHESAPKLRYGFGKPATESEVAAWNIDVRPDGHGLPKGSGSVQRGQQVYDAKCASCHGTFGESNDYMQIAGGVGTLKSDRPIRTVGSKLNYATTLWDYINRAMPFTAPQTLTVDEVYSLTAYVLHLNEILPADGRLDEETLPQVRMPNRDGFTTNHGFMRRDGKPDVRNIACMKNCQAEVKITSAMPEYAKGAHGELAEQSRPLSVIRGAGAVADRVVLAKPVGKSFHDGMDIAKKSACLACHGVERKVVGPGFREVAAKYASDGTAATRLASKVKAGGAGVWGQVPMPPQSQLTDAEVNTVVAWILGGAN